MENTENPIDHTETKQGPKWFHNAWISRGTLLIAGLFFLLPFININCSGAKLASIRGTDMVFGNELKPPAEKKEEIKNNDSSVDSLEKGLDAAADSLTQSINSLSDSIGGAFGKAFKGENPFMPTDMMEGKGKRIEPNILAITSFAFILLAFVFSFFAKRAFAVISGILAAGSALSLFFIQVQISSEIQKQLGPMNFIPITFEFTSFYWLCILFLVIASVFSFIRTSIKV